MDISNMFGGISAYETGAVTTVPTARKHPEQNTGLATGDTVSISDEARSLFAQMQAGSVEVGSEVTVGLENGENLVVENAETQLLDTHPVESSGATEKQDMQGGQDSEGSAQGGGGGSGGGGGGGGGSGESDTSESSLQSEIAAITSQLSQARASAKESGDSSQVNALQAELATLQAELSSL